MPEDKFFREGMQFLQPQMLQMGLGKMGLGQLNPYAPPTVTAVGNVLGNILEGNLGISKEDETGSFTFDPIQEGFTIKSNPYDNLGFDLSVYGNKAGSSPGLNYAPYGNTSVEANFRVGGGMTRPEEMGGISFTNLPVEDTRSAGRKFLDAYLSRPK